MGTFLVCLKLYKKWMRIHDTENCELVLVAVEVETDVNFPEYKLCRCDCVFHWRTWQPLCSICLSGNKNGQTINNEQ